MPISITKVGHITLALLASLMLLGGCSPAQTSSQASTKDAPAAAPEPLKEPEPKFKKPEHIRGVYLTAWSAGSKKKMEKIFALLEATELNSVVIDIRDAGEMYVKTDIPLASEVGANKIAITDLKAVLDGLAEKKIYPIARISCFRDKFVPNKKRELAVVLKSGEPWKDRSGHTWLDPYNKANWEYIAQVVDVALDAGFPEIQLDYVRFPSEGKASTQMFPAKKSYDNPNAVPTEVVAAFAEFIRERVHAKKALLSADIFGIVSSGDSDQGIGQELMTISKPFDIVSPMTYPSHYAKGEYGIADPNRAPYAILKKSLKDYAKRLPDKEIRPWLQDFSLFGVTYGKEQVRAQIKACYESGYKDFLLWNPRNVYTEEAVKDTTALLPKKQDAIAKDESKSAQ